VLLVRGGCWSRSGPRRSDRRTQGPPRPGPAGRSTPCSAARTPGPGARRTFPLGVTAPCMTVRLTGRRTQGRCRDVIERIPTVSAPGITSWPLAVPTLQSLGAKHVLLAMTAMGNGPHSLPPSKLCRPARAGFDVTLETWDAKRARGSTTFSPRRPPEVVPGLAAAVRLRDEISGPGFASPDQPTKPAPDPIAAAAVPACGTGEAAFRCGGGICGRARRGAEHVTGNGSGAGSGSGWSATRPRPADLVAETDGGGQAGYDFGGRRRRKGRRSPCRVWRPTSPV